MSILSKIGIFAETTAYPSSKCASPVSLLLDSLELYLRFEYLPVLLDLVIFLHFLDFQPILIVFFHLVTLRHLTLVSVLVELVHHSLLLQLSVK